MDTCLRLSNMRRECKNILIVTVTKIVKFENGKEDRPANLSMEDVGNLLFDIIKLDVSLTTNQYDTKEINLKPDVDPSKYLMKAPIEFKGQSITVTQQRASVAKVTRSEDSDTFNPIPKKSSRKFRPILQPPQNCHF